MSINLGSLIVSIGADLSQFDNAINKAGKSMQNVGKKMSTAITAPILAAGTAAFNLHKGFESSMQKINGLVGVSQKQVNEWSQDIIRLAPQLGKAPKELADGLFFVTSAGIKGAEAMDVLTASAKASAAGLGETATIADLVTSAMNAYGKENLSAADATNVLVASVREGKAEASELAGAMGQVLPIASEMGVSFDQVGASVAAMTRTGTEATTAAMQLKNILAGLLKPSDQAAEALEMMGTSASEMRRMIREDGLIKTLGELRKMTNQYGEDAMATVFPNIRALSGVLDLMGSNAADNVKIFEALEDTTGALDKAFASAAQTAQFKWDQAVVGVKTSLTSFGQAIATAILPLMEKFTGLIQDLTTWFNGLTQAQQQSIIKWAAIAAAIGPVLIIIGQVVSAISMLGPLFAALTGPIGLVIAAIAALAAGILYVWDNWEAIKERISDINWWKNALVSMLQFLIKFNPFHALIEGYNALVSKIGGDPIPNPFNMITDELEKLKVETKEYENEFGSFTDSLKNGMSAVTGIFDNFGGGGAGSIVEPMIPTSDQISRLKELQPAFEGLNTTITNTKTLVDEEGMLDRVTPSLEDIEQMRLWTQELAFMSEGITNAVNGAMVDAAVGVGEMLGAFASGASGIKTFGGLVKGLGVVVMEAVAGLAKQIGTMAIESGVALMAIKLGLNSLNPGVMIAAGVALVALSSAIRAKSQAMSGSISNKGGDGGASNLQGLATGGTVTSAGAFMVGEKGPEMVSLPAGAAVTPNHMLGKSSSMLQGQLVARVTGRDLEFVLDQYNEDKERIS